MPALNDSGPVGTQYAWLPFENSVPLTAPANVPVPFDGEVWVTVKVKSVENGDPLEVVGVPDVRKSPK